MPPSTTIGLWAPGGDRNPREDLTASAVNFFSFTSELLIAVRTLQGIR